MIKILQKSLLASAIIFSAASLNAQTIIINENFQTWDPMGYSNGNPGSVGDNTNTSDCEVSSSSNFTPVSVPALNKGVVTYSLVEASVAPQCFERGGTTAGCIRPASRGYVMLTNTLTASFTTSVLSNVGTIDLGLSATGGNRGALLLKSTDGGTNWVPVQLLAAPSATGCHSAYGYYIADIVINEPSVRLRITPDPTNLQRVRIHDLVVREIEITGTQDFQWTDNGLTFVSQENTLTISSKNLSGYIDLVSMTGTVIDKKSIQAGSESTFNIPSGGLYIMRFVSGNKAFTKKVSVK